MPDSVLPTQRPSRRIQPFNSSGNPLLMLIFGSQVHGIEYIPRPGGYAIIEHDGAIAVVATPSGVHLPGGGIDPGESADVATLREVREECGFDVAIVRELGRADEYVHDAIAGVHYIKHCTFYEATILSGDRFACEADHELHWMTPDEAIASLTHASQRWAVEQFVRDDGKSPTSNTSST